MQHRRLWSVLRGGGGGAHRLVLHWRGLGHADLLGAGSVARAARLLTFDAAEAYDRGDRCDMEAGIAKFYASEAAVANSQDAMRVFGGYSYSKEYDIERLYRDSMLM
jgi:alkylation response protein AidB-like acyl-CoA dehydrogenase